MPKQRRVQENPAETEPAWKSLLATRPAMIARTDAAALVKEMTGIETTRRALEGLPLPTRMINGRAYFHRAQLLAYFQRKIDEAPDVQGGRKEKAAA